jgi:hypothetical protein
MSKREGAREMNDDYDWETINTMQPYEVICCGV